MELIHTHQNADFDAVASMLGAHKLHPQATPVLPSRLQGSVREFITLYQNGLPFVAWDDFQPDAPITRLILTDTQTPPSAKWFDADAQIPTLIIEHHTQERPMQPHETWAGEAIGAATTLTIEQMQGRDDIHLTSLEATLLALGIYMDTGMLTYGKTTPRDIKAAAWLLEKGAVLDTIRRFSSHPLNAAQQALFEQLLDAPDTRRVQGYDITLCQATVDEHISGINTVTERLRDVLDADAVFVVVQLPKQVQMVARSTVDAVSAGEVATALGGGGHPRAAAAAIYDDTLENAISRLWAYLRQHVQPAVRVADLMSHGEVQTLYADETIQGVIQRLRRIGHEGYPVLDDAERVVGLLTLRAADKALEHGLTGASVREVMQSGEVTLTPDDSVALLEERMVSTDWGQIPVVNGEGQLLGIVTRTDLIQHWGQTHPATPADDEHIDPTTIREILGADNHTLIDTIMQHAQEQRLSVYIVGGVVRDLFLERANYDIDFVVEGAGIAFAEHLRETYGGSIHSYAPFGTATWHLDESVAKTIGVAVDDIPDHLDFATARSELYEHPTALPTVYSSGIKLDLRRRDFTINTLAIQISPAARQWRVLDFYGGIADLQERVIRVLHSLSFIDDPTRILRGVRFSERLRFTIEPRTAELIQTALPMLRRITGARLKNEFNLIMNEDAPEKILLKLEALGVLPHIQEGFHARPTIRKVFQRERTAERPQWEDSRAKLRWHLLLAPLPVETLRELGKRLHFSQSDTEATCHTSTLVNQPETLSDPATPPSAIVAHLENVPDISLVAAWLWFADDDITRENIRRYHDEWQHVAPTVTGHTLKERGLPPSPHYRVILAHLRDAWLDGTISNERDETALLDELIREVRHDRPE